MSHSSDPGFWQWLVGTVLGGMGGLFGYHKYIVSRIDKKADRAVVDAIRDEIGIQRGQVDRLSDQIRQSDQRAQDRHERLLERLTGERK